MIRKPTSLATALIVLALLFAVVPLVPQPAQAHPDPWWNSNWQYRMLINITENSGSTLTNYQVPITLTTITFNYSKSNASGNDIRFATDGTECDYWIETWNTGGTSTIWVEVPSIPASSTTTIYMYYGNSVAGAASSESAVFDYVDRGDQTSSWTLAGSSGQNATEGNPSPGYYAASSSGSYMYRNINLAPERIVTFNIKSDGLGNLFFLVNSTGAGQMYRLDTRGGTEYAGFAATANWTSWNAPASGFNAAADAWYKLTIVITSSASATFYYEQTTSSSPSGFGTQLGTYAITNNGGYIGLVGDALGAAYTTWWDNIIVRKYASSEPTVNPGQEESSTSWMDYLGGTAAISASTNITVSGGDVELGTTSGTSTYDFSTATAGTTKWGYICSDATSFSTGTFSPGSETEFSSAQYTSVSAPEETAYVETDTWDAKTHRFTFRINEAEGDVSQIYAQVKVMSEDPDDHRLYIWNYATTDWELLDSSTTQDTWEILEGTKSSSVGDYIEDATGDVSILFYIIDPGFASVRWIRTDYAKVEVSYSAYKSPGELKSTAITPEILGSWGNFTASHNLPTGTDISYKILKAPDDSTLCTITAAQAAAGYNISSCAGTISSIKLYAELSTTGSNTPTLHDWKVTWVANTPPTVDDVELYSDSAMSTVANEMTPQAEYYLKVTVNDANGVDNIAEVKAKIYYDSAGSNPDESGFTTGNNQTCAILTWNTTGWSIDAGASTSWGLITGDCSKPSTGTGGDWKFAFKPGKVATESTDWDLHGRGTDNATLTAGRYCYNKTMNWYGEITVGTSTVSWGTVSPGCSNETSPVVNITYICNGNYTEQVKTSQKWTSASGNLTLNTTGSPGTGEFSLKADDDATLADAVQVLSASYTTFDTGTQTTESGNVENNNHLWLSLGSGIPVATYSGTIYFGIAQ